MHLPFLLDILLHMSVLEINMINMFGNFLDGITHELFMNNVIVAEYSGYKYNKVQHSEMKTSCLQVYRTCCI